MHQLITARCPKCGDELLGLENPDPGGSYGAECLHCHRRYRVEVGQDFEPVEVLDDQFELWA